MDYAITNEADELIILKDGRAASSWDAVGRIDDDVLAHSKTLGLKHSKSWDLDLNWSRLRKERFPLFSVPGSVSAGIKGRPDGGFVDSDRHTICNMMLSHPGSTVVVSSTNILNKAKVINSDRTKNAGRVGKSWFKWRRRRWGG